MPKTTKEILYESDGNGELPSFDEVKKDFKHLFAIVKYHSTLIVLILIMGIGIIIAGGIKLHSLQRIISTHTAPEQIVVHDIVNPLENYSITCKSYEKVPQLMYNLTCQWMFYFSGDKSHGIHDELSDNPSCENGETLNMSSTIVYVDGDCLEYGMYPKNREIIVGNTYNSGFIKISGGN